MAEQWIDAATARQLVTAPPLEGSGVGALLERVHAGLVKTKARLLIMGDGRAEGVAVPSEVWTTGQRAKLEQDWGTGDFWGHLDGSGDDRWQAFGVTFALGGVLEMLPAERRPMAASSLSVASDPAWMTARAARRFAYGKADVSVNGAAPAVVDQAMLGFVTGRAVFAQRFEGGRHGRPPSWDDRPSWEEREWNIPPSFWREFKVGRQSVHDWERGIFSGAGPGPRGPCLLRLEGVHFLAESLQVLLPAGKRGGADEATVKNQGKGGGQPPRAFWDEMLCHIWALIYQGTFTPKLQKDVEVAMLTWAERKGEKLSEATARPKAKLLFERYRYEAENFLAEE